MFVIYCLTFVLGYVSREIYDKSDKINRIHDVISENTHGFFNSWYNTIKTIAKIQYENVYDKYVRELKTPHYISHDLYEIEYFHKGKRYRLHLNDRIGDRVSLNVYNEKGDEITSRFMEYFGPQYDFHNRSYTPKDLGCKQLVIIDGNFNEIVYNENEIIKIQINES